MGPDMAVELARRLLIEAMMLSAPMLLAACLISVTLSLLQTLTGVQEQTLTVVPRLIVVFVRYGGDDAVVCAQAGELHDCVVVGLSSVSGIT